MANYSCKKTFATTYPSARIHPWRTDRRTDRRQPCQYLDCYL